MNVQPQPQPDRMKFNPEDNSWRILAPAKINLNLHVGPLREDGFHPVDSIIAKIAFYDEIVLVENPQGDIVFSTEGIECCEDKDNLALRAAKMLAEGRKTPGIKIHLKKNIQPGRGLGGGSSDAAAILLALNQIWKLDLDMRELSAMAGSLGSDVPLFLSPAASRVTGRGETCTPISLHPFWIVLITAPLACPTGQIYKQYDAAPKELSPQLDTRLFQDPPSRWEHLLKNDLTSAAHTICPELKTLHYELNGILNGRVKMTGSGSALFTVHDTPLQAARTLAKLPKQVQGFSIVTSLNRAFA